MFLSSLIVAANLLAPAQAGDAAEERCAGVEVEVHRAVDLPTNPHLELSFKMVPATHPQLSELAASFELGKRAPDLVRMTDSRGRLVELAFDTMNPEWPQRGFYPRKPLRPLSRYRVETRCGTDRAFETAFEFRTRLFADRSAPRWEGVDAVWLWGPGGTILARLAPSTGRRAPVEVDVGWLTRDLGLPPAWLAPGAEAPWPNPVQATEGVILTRVPTDAAPRELYLRSRDAAGNLSAGYTRIVVDPPNGLVYIDTPERPQTPAIARKRERFVERHLAERHQAMSVPDTTAPADRWCDLLALDSPWISPWPTNPRFDLLVATGPSRPASADLLRIVDGADTPFAIAIAAQREYGFAVWPTENLRPFRSYRLEARCDASESWREIYTFRTGSGPDTHAPRWPGVLGTNTRISLRGSKQHTLEMPLAPRGQDRLPFMIDVWREVDRPVAIPERGPDLSVEVPHGCAPRCTVELPEFAPASGPGGYFVLATRDASGNRSAQFAAVRYSPADKDFTWWTPNLLARWVDHASD